MGQVNHAKGCAVSKTSLNKSKTT